MRSYDSFTRVYYYNGAVDFRKSINGLCIMVEHEFRLQLVESSLFVFISRDRRKLKALYFDRTGFALWQKRLEIEKFKIPKPENQVVVLSPRDYGMLLDGYDIFKNKPHEKISFAQFS